MGVRLLVGGANLCQLLWHQDPMSTFLAIRNCQFNSPALRICCNGRRTGRVRNLSGRLATAWPAALRSEEHTSELQSRPHLVCRLLLEKKKKYLHNSLVSKKNKKK